MCVCTRIPYISSIELFTKSKKIPRQSTTRDTERYILMEEYVLLHIKQYKMGPLQLINATAVEKLLKEFGKGIRYIALLQYPLPFYYYLLTNAFLCISKYPSCPALMASSLCFNRAFSMGSSPGVFSMFCNLPLCPLQAM